MRSTGEAALFAVVAVLCAFAVDYCTGCTPREVKEAEAESAYLAEQLRCVDVAYTRQEADICRQQVQAKWGIAQTVRVRDAGVDR
jgi:hypothetical protein